MSEKTSSGKNFCSFVPTSQTSLIGQERQAQTQYTSKYEIIIHNDLKITCFIYTHWRFSQRRQGMCTLTVILKSSDWKSSIVQWVRADSRARLPGFESYLHPILTGVSMSQFFLNYKTEILTLSMLTEINISSAYQNAWYTVSSIQMTVAIKIIYQSLYRKSRIEKV